MFLMTAIFFLSWFGQSVNGWRTFNNTRDEHKSVHISPLFASGVPGESCTRDGSRAPTKGKPDAGDSRLRDRVPTLRLTVLMFRIRFRNLRRCCSLIRRGFDSGGKRTIADWFRPACCRGAVGAHARRVRLSCVATRRRGTGKRSSPFDGRAVSPRRRMRIGPWCCRSHRR
jgi:hypothetical protein